MRRLNHIPQWIDGFWLVLLAVYVMAGVIIVPFHGDESTLIYMGRDYTYHFVEGDLSNIVYDKNWRISPSEQHLRLLNGTIPKYLFGWVTVSKGNTLDDINEQWDWSGDYDYNQNTGRIPNDDLLMPARYVSAIQLAGAIVVFFIIARLVFNRPTAYLASLYLTLNPAILINGRRAMMEGSHLLFIMLVIMAGVLLIRERKWWQFILLGVVSGLAVAAKHPNALVVALVFMAGGSYVLIQSLRHFKTMTRSTIRFIGGLVVSGLLALVVFYGLNPAWWDAPIERASEVLRLRNELLDIQIDQFGTFNSASEQLETLFNFVFVAKPQYFEAPQWADYADITAQIQAYEQSVWSGVAIGGSAIGGLIVMSLAGFGTIHFARNKQIALDMRWLILVWGVGIIIITFVVTPLKWQRYYLPIYPIVGLMMAYSVSTLTTFIWKRIKQ